MPYFQRHLFFCTNLRQNGKRCCAQNNAAELKDYAKQKLKRLGLHGPGNYRVNNAGCLDRCEQGPVLVIYPDGIWYRYDNQADVDEIIEQHVLKGQIVHRLQLSNKPSEANLNK